MAYSNFTRYQQQQNNNILFAFPFLYFYMFFSPMPLVIYFSFFIFKLIIPRHRFYAGKCLERTRESEVAISVYFCTQ